MRPEAHGGGARQGEFWCAAVFGHPRLICRAGRQKLATGEHAGLLGHPQCHRRMIEPTAHVEREGGDAVQPVALAPLARAYCQHRQGDEE